jgi:cobyrinic acid a,c-diamide synthase
VNAIAPRGLIISAPASGSGKTVVTLGLLRRLARSRLIVGSVKVGPDYIDPAFHAVATGRPALNIDSWAMRPETIDVIRARLGETDFVIAEGAMGLFDGAPDGRGSTADLAERTGWPVILVIDARAQAASAAALVQGFANHRPGVRVAGVIFNRVGSDNHARILDDAVAEAMPEIARLGSIRRDDSLSLPERHLGLVPASEHPELERFLDRASEAMVRQLDTARFCTLAEPWGWEPPAATIATPVPPLGQRIAIAGDEAFAFRYALVVEGWRAAGAEIMPFSPLAGEAPDASADAVYLPGGYPELHAGKLASSEKFMGGLRGAADRGAVVFGECGGYMVLGRGLVDSDGQRHAMAGLLPLETSFAAKKLHLGYRRVRVTTDGPLGQAGSLFRGHEFHYAAILAEGPGAPLFDGEDASGRRLGTTGLANGRVIGSFVHLIDREGHG